MALIDYKTKISLPDYIMSTNLGFEVHPESTNNNVRLVRYRINENGEKIKKPNGKYEKELNFLFKKKENGVFIYFDYKRDDPQNDGKHHTVLDFVQEQVLNKSLEEPLDVPAVAAILDRYMSSDKYVLPSESQFNIKHSSKSLTVDDRIFDNVIEPPGEHSDRYFQRRKIPSEYYSHPIFSKTFGTHAKTISNDGVLKEYKNHAFLFQNNKGQIVAVQDLYYNSNGKQMINAGVRGNGVIKSAYFKPEHQASKRSLILIESGEDMISHLSIFYSKMKGKEFGYEAYGGALGFNQLRQTQQNISRDNVNQLVTGFDNDSAGRVYTVKVYLNLMVDLSKEKGFPISVGDRAGIIEIKGHGSGREVLDQVMGELNKNIDLLKGISDNIGVQSIYEQSSKENILRIPDTNQFVDKEFVPMLNKLHSNIEISVHRPRQNDWNKQLENNIEQWKRRSISPNNKGKEFF